MSDILLDTCVIAETRRASPNPGVIGALRDAGSNRLFISVVTVGELTKGAAQLPDSRRRTEIGDRNARDVAAFEDRVLPVDIDTSIIWGELTGRCQQQGIIIAAADGLIAATAIRHGMPVMTRNIRHFEPTGVEILDPWNGAT